MRGDTPTFEQRHFVWIAAQINGIQDIPTRQGQAHWWADRLAQTNPRFNRVRFLAAALEEA